MEDSLAEQTGSIASQGLAAMPRGDHGQSSNGSRLNMPDGREIAAVQETVIGTCLNCMAWDREATNAGLCRRAPPIGNVRGSMTSYATWPRTERDDWCLSWVQGEERDPDDDGG